MTEPLWNAAGIVKATGGKATRDFAATGVSIDSRSLVPGDLFVALTDRRDGHDFVAAALEAGAAGALVARVPEGVAEDAPLVIVPDVLAALTALGAAGRARSRARVVGVTGSVGKTSTKEMLRAALARQGNVHAAEASFNNHWGVPLTLARLPKAADFAVIEIGMNRPGEIAPLSRLARPHVALITTVAPAHLEAFDDLSGIAREKAAIFEGLEPDGVAIFYDDMPPEPRLIVEGAAWATGGRVLRFGTDADSCDYRLATIRLTGSATMIEADLPSGRQLVRLSVPGRHFAANAVAVLAVADALGADATLAARDLSLWRPPAGRGTRETIVLDSVEALSFGLIDDAFNANPASMQAALEVLAAAEPTEGVGRIARGRRIAILGDMLELGPEEVAMHRALADLAQVGRIDIVHCVGPRMQALWEELPQARRGEWHETAGALAARAHALVDAGDVVLVKGSKGSLVSRVVDALRKLGQADASDTQGAE